VQRGESCPVPYDRSELHFFLSAKPLLLDGLVAPMKNIVLLSREESLEGLRDAVALILEDLREVGVRGVPSHADRTAVTVE
jgi:hypothetical protein